MNLKFFLSGREELTAALARLKFLPAALFYVCVCVLTKSIRLAGFDRMRV